MRPEPRGSGNMMADRICFSVCACFNEAGAARPRKFWHTCANCDMQPRFNEAGAARPRKYERSAYAWKNDVKLQ